MPVPLAGRSKAWVCGCSLAELRVRIQPEHGCLTLVSVVGCKVGLCVELITRPGEPYRVWLV